MSSHSDSFEWLSAQGSLIDPYLHASFLDQHFNSSAPLTVYVFDYLSARTDFSNAKEALTLWRGFLSASDGPTTDEDAPHAEASCTDADSPVLGDIDHLYVLSAAEDVVALLRAVFRLTESLMSKGDFVQLNEVLEKIEPERLLDTASVSIARSTARARSRLPAWNGFVVRTWRELVQKNENASHRMRGLISKDDSSLFATRQAVS